MPSKSTLTSWNWSELDVLIVNQGEGLDLIAALSGQERSEDEDAVETLKQLAALDQLKTHLTWIVMTRGSQGVAASVLLQGQSERTLFSLAASKPRQVKDTTGAGDTFAGYLVSSLAKAAESKGTDNQGCLAPRTRPASEDEVVACLSRAKMAAAMAVEIKGAMESIPTEDQVEERLRSESK